MRREVGVGVALIALLALAAGTVTAPPRAQEPSGPPVDSGLVERSEVNLGVLEVVVLDRRGRHVRDVPAEAFHLRAAGRPVPIVSVDEIDLVPEATRETRRGREAPEPDTAAGEVPAGEAGATPRTDALTAALAEAREAREAGTRWFVMAFDGYNNVSPLRMSQVRGAAKGWIKRNKRPGDLVAIYSFNPYLNSLVGFTTETDVLFDAIDSAPVFPSGEGMGREMISQRLEQGDRMPREYLEEQLLNASRFGEDLMAAERETYYENVLLLGDALGRLPGTKAVLLFSGGFPLTRSKTTAASGGLTPLFRDMLSSLTRQGVRVFSFDIGEEGGFSDAEEATNYRLQLDQLGLGTDWLDTLQIGAQVSGINAHQEILSALGSETGGRFFAGKNYRDALDAADDDLSHYYLLTFDRGAINRALGGTSRYVKLDVDLSESGYRVISRRGRFESPDEDEARATEAARSVVRTATAAPQAARPDLELDGQVAFFPTADGRTVAVLALRTGPLPGLQRAGDLTLLDATLTVDVAGQDGVLVSGDRDLRLELPESASSAVAEGVRLREGVVLDAAGRAVFDVHLRLNGLDREAAWTREVRVPSWGDATFGLADLVVFAPLDRTPLVFDAFFGQQTVHAASGAIAMADPLGAREGGRSTTYVGGTLPTAVPLVVQTRVVAPPAPPADGSSPLRLDWELVPAAGGDSAFPPVRYRRVQPVDGGASLDVVVDLDVSGVPPGDYRLRLSAEDLVGGGTAVAESPVILAR